MAYTQKEKQTSNCSGCHTWLTDKCQQDMTDLYKEMQRAECRRSEGSFCSHTLFAKYHSTNATACVQKEFNKKYYSSFVHTFWYLATGRPSPLAASPHNPTSRALTHCIFQPEGTTISWSSEECVTRCLSTPQHKHLCWDQALTVTRTQAALKPLSRLGKCCEMVPT